eukprot:CAMPEP_0173427680 /NCGR_PEP_ID=MMETSP1357-20121228/6824_1 /TAXON_ID=77926 /ORGANISM="Hemiselmis rufescens, Strain PCC563" /LENGTH=103 /DNA_ID=CAMNT_0014391565 /DNA_START=103 /DNA_END=411 /DNA_ORIENTATION=-
MTEAFSFNSPSLSSVTRRNAPGTGSASVTVHGASFGHSGYSAGVRVGFSACESSDWVSDTEVACRVALGVRGTRRVTVTAGSRVGSVSEAFSFDVGTISTLTR